MRSLNDLWVPHRGNMAGSLDFTDERSMNKQDEQVLVEQSGKMTAEETIIKKDLKLG